MGSRSRSPSRPGAGVLLALLGVVAGFLGGFMGGFMGGLFRRRAPGRYVSDRHAPTAD
jgi:hypothetical protein